MEHALDDGLFVLHLQPIVEVTTGRIVGAEALVRLADAEELVPPGVFVGQAERLGLAARLDAWVIRRSLELLAGFHEVDPAFAISINLSGGSLTDPLVEKALTEEIARHDIDPCTVLLEVTETAALGELALARAFTERMSTLGLHIALDDFGTGYGSFYYLKHLHFDFVKVNGEFVENAPSSFVDRAIVHSILDITHKLGKRAIAEYVATPEIAEVVREEGFDLAQGYLLGCPVPPEQFRETYLGRRSAYASLFAKGR